MIALEFDDELDTLSDDDLHQRLAEFNARRFEPTIADPGLARWRRAV